MVYIGSPPPQNYISNMSIGSKVSQCTGQSSRQVAASQPGGQQVWYCHSRAGRSLVPKIIT